MPFRIKKKIASLQAYSMQNKTPITHKHKEKPKTLERVSLSSYLHKLIPNKKYKASLSVESAVVLPVFIFAVIVLIYICRIINYSDLVLESMHQCGKDMALKAYVTKGSDAGEVAGRLGGVLLSETYVKAQVEKNINKEGFKYNNISFLRSKIMDNDIIDLVAVEEVTLPYNMFGIRNFVTVDRIYMHAFTGYDNTKAQNVTGEDDDEIVYITTNGTVYHTSRSCSHLKIDIKRVNSQDIDNCRNNGGGKYYECEYCDRINNAGGYYITGYGDRYHKSVNCPGLKRDIKAVKKSEVSGRRACKDCGG